MKLVLPKKIRIVEVGPRDGLQNEPSVLDTASKAQFIQRLADAGLTTIEATSFVRPERVPQMSDAKELFAMVKDLKVALPCLVPNMKGLETAIQCGVKEIAVFTATSDTFNMKNINATVDESFTRITPVVERALKEGMRVRGYTSTAFGCPYEGKTSVDRLVEVSGRLLDLGCYEVSVGDTIGVANPVQVVEVIAALEKKRSLDKFSMHFHDTRGTALVNILAALQCGITLYDASAAGLGGCPYAQGATGNMPTEDLVYLCHSMGIETGVDLDKLVSASTFVLAKIGRPSSSKFLTAYLSGNRVCMP